MLLTTEQTKTMLPNRLRMRVARMFRMLFSAKIPCPQIILEKEYEMIGEAIRDIRESDADIKILSDAELKEFFPDGLMASIDRIDSTPSPVESKMEWRESNSCLWALYLNDKCVGRCNRFTSQSTTWYSSCFIGLSQENNRNIESLSEAKLWVEQTVSAELNSLGSDGRILQAVEQLVKMERI